MCIILLAHISLIMRTQACSCMRMILPQNPKPNSSDFASDSTCNTSVLDHFSCIHAFKLPFHMFNCLIAFHMLELGFYLVFPCFDTMNTHSHVHA